MSSHLVLLSIPLLSQEDAPVCTGAFGHEALFLNPDLITNPVLKLLLLPSYCSRWQDRQCFEILSSKSENYHVSLSLKNLWTCRMLCGLQDVLELLSPLRLTTVNTFLITTIYIPILLLPS